MSTEDPIGIMELINKVKDELLSTESSMAHQSPFLSVDKVTLELKVTVNKEGKAGIQIHVVEIGGGIGRNDVQTVQIELSPLLDKEERLRLYKDRFPEQWDALEDANLEGSLKGPDIT